MASLMLRPYELIFELLWKHLVQLQSLLITRKQSHFRSPVTRILLPKLLSLISFIWDFIGTTVMSSLFWKQWLSYLQSLTYRTPFLPLSFSPTYLFLILPKMLYVLLFRRNSLGRLIPLAILAFHVRINSLSGKKLPTATTVVKWEFF